MRIYSIPFGSGEAKMSTTGASEAMVGCYAPQRKGIRS